MPRLTPTVDRSLPWHCVACVQWCAAISVVIGVELASSCLEGESSSKQRTMWGLEAPIEEGEHASTDFGTLTRPHSINAVEYSTGGGAN